MEEEEKRNLFWRKSTATVYTGTVINYAHKMFDFLSLFTRFTQKHKFEARS